jgi:hypothetical protein
MNKPKFAKVQLQKLKEMMAVNSQILGHLGQDAKGIELEIEKDEIYTKLMDAEESEIDKEIKTSLEEWIISYKMRLWQDFDNTEDKNITIDEFRQTRVTNMLQKNPKFILRNNLAQE